MGSLNISYHVYNEKFSPFLVKSHIDKVYLYASCNYCMFVI